MWTDDWWTLRTNNIFPGTLHICSRYVGEERGLPRSLDPYTMWLMPANGAWTSDASPLTQVPVRTRALICPRNIPTLSLSYNQPALGALRDKFRPVRFYTLAEGIMIWVRGLQRSEGDVSYYHYHYQLFCELREKWMKVDKLNANKTHKLNCLISNKRKDAKTLSNLCFNSQNRCNDLY